MVAMDEEGGCKMMKKPKLYIWASVMFNIHTETGTAAAVVALAYQNKWTKNEFPF